MHIRTEKHIYQIYTQKHVHNAKDCQYFVPHLQGNGREGWLLINLMLFHSFS